jgi:hypothetical protein
MVRRRLNDEREKPAGIPPHEPERRPPDRRVWPVSIGSIGTRMAGGDAVLEAGAPDAVGGRQSFRLCGAMAAAAFHRTRSHVVLGSGGRCTPVARVWDSEGCNFLQVTGAGIVHTSGGHSLYMKEPRIKSMEEALKILEEMGLMWRARWLACVVNGEEKLLPAGIEFRPLNPDFPKLREVQAFYDYHEIRFRVDWHFDERLKFTAAQ